MQIDISRYPIIETDSPLPADISIKANNSYCFQCPALQRSAGYPVCLHVLKAMDENRLESHSFADCQRAVTHGECAAVALRKAEREAGKALYYRERKPFVATKPEPDEPTRQETPDHIKNTDSYKRGWNQVKGSKTKDVDLPSHKKPATKKVAPNKRTSLEDGALDMQKMVNDAVKNQTKSPVTQTQRPQPKAKQKPQKGESLINFIRRTKKAS